MNAFKQQCIDLRRQDYTLPEIVHITGRPKTSVHFHIQDLPLSFEKQREIRQSRRESILRVVEKRRVRSAEAFRRFAKWDINTVCAISHFLFDGEIRHGCIYNNRNVALIERVRHSMSKMYDFEPKFSKNQLTGVSRISYYNSELGKYVKTKAERLLRDIAVLPRNLKREFVQSFFDDEGCMDFRLAENIRRVRGYQKNVRILYLVQKLLTDLGINSNIKAPNEVVITGKENLMKFQKEINFSHGVRINGNRPNSIWKKHLEKREILRRAIKSYKT
ncbi:MAG: LAGLIDADG family homing endonuclease [bacterium]|nr:LAGLIDADG family homing endonuclease [bacterium]